MGKKAGLSRDLVIAAAAELADQGGLEAVTLAAVAERLSVRSPSLYAHVDGLPGLLRELTIHAARSLALDLRTARRGQFGLTALRALATAYRRFATLHPGWYAAAMLPVPNGNDDTRYQALAESVLPLMEALAEAGVPPRDMLHQVRAVRSALHGFVSLERANSFGMAADFDQSFRHLVDLICRGIAAPAA
jgi:AcrR family transcriptional regulator